MLSSDQTASLLGSLQELVNKNSASESISRADMLSLLDIYITDQTDKDPLTDDPTGYRQVTPEPKSITFGSLSDDTVDKIASYIPEIKSPSVVPSVSKKSSDGMSLQALGFMLPALPLLPFLLPEGTGAESLISYTTSILDAIDLGMEEKKKKDQLKRRRRLNEIKKQRVESKAKRNNLKRQNQNLRNENSRLKKRLSTHKPAPKPVTTT